MTTALVYPPAPGPRDGRDAQAPVAGQAGLRTGVRCRVHLRRDAAGLAGGAPLSIVGTSRLGEMASVSGVIERVEADAVVLRGEGSTYWIPREAILAVEFSDERRP